MLDLESLIAPPKTVPEAIKHLCNVLSYDTQGWISSLTPEQAEWLCESDLSTQVRVALFENKDNRALMTDCDATDAKGATRRIVYSLWVHLKITA